MYTHTIHVPSYFVSPYDIVLATCAASSSFIVYQLSPTMCPSVCTCTEWRNVRSIKLLGLNGERTLDAMMYDHQQYVNIEFLRHVVMYSAGPMIASAYLG